MGRMEQARKQLAKAIACRYPNHDVEREEWLALAQSGQMRDAQPHLAELLINPGEDGAEICEAFVNGYFLTNQFNKALELLSTWEAAFPQDSQPHFFRGKYEEGRANFSEAVNAYRQGLLRESDRHELRLGLSRCLIALHQHEEASMLLDSLKAETPNHPDVLETLGRCLLQRGEMEKSLEVLNQLLNQDPRHVNARLLIARCYLEGRRYQEALSLLTELVAERSFDIEVRYSLAQALQAVGDTQHAAEEFRFVTVAREAISHARKMADTVISKEPSNADLRYQIGVILLKYESPEAGAGWLRSALEFAPDHPRANLALAEYYKQRGFLDLAKSHRKHTGRSDGVGDGP